MTIFLQAAGFLALLGLVILWGLAFWKRPQLAYGVLIGVICAALVTFLSRSVEFHEIPVWLPAVPFAVVALALFFFGFLAWYWGRSDQ